MAEPEKKTDMAEDLKKALALFTFKGQMDRYKPVDITSPSAAAACRWPRCWPRCAG